MTPASDSAPGIVYLASGPAPPWEANSIHIVKMCTALMETGARVELLVPERGVTAKASALADKDYYGTERVLDVSSVWQPAVRGGMWLYRRRLRNLLAEKKPDYVYGRNLWGCATAARAGWPTVFEAHMPVWRTGGRTARVFEDLVNLPAAEAVVVISNALVKALKEDYPAMSKPVIVAHDGASWCERAPDVGETLSEPVNVLYAGSLYPGKGMETLSALAPRCPWARFGIVGGTREQIEKWRRSMPPDTSNMEFLGHRPHARVREDMARADILVAPYQETVGVHGGRHDVGRWMSPLKIFEYMAANRPMIASDLPVLREVLSHRRNALLARPGDPDAWVAAIESLRDTPGLAASIAARARDEFEMHYTWRARAFNILDTLGWRCGPAAGCRRAAV